MQIVDDKILLFRTRNPEKYRMIPRHKVVGEPAPGVFEIACLLYTSDAADEAYDV